MATTKALRKIAKSRKRITLAFGGQGAGKTYAICQILANECTHKRLTCYVIGAEKTKLNDRALRDMKNILLPFISEGYVSFINNSIFKFQNGSEIRFIGLDKEERGKSIRCDIAYFNEVTEIKSFLAFDHFASRARKTYADFNPSEKFFIDEIREQYAGKIDEIKLTWRDNEFISKEELDRIFVYKKLGEHARVGSYSRYMYEVYYLGNYSELGGGVFDNIYEISKPDYDEIDAVETLGIDFGDNDDPNALVGVKFKGKEIFVREYLYKSMLSDRYVSEVISAIQKKKQILFYETATGGHTRIANMLSNRDFRVTPVAVKKQSVTSSVMSLCDYDKIHVCGENARHEFASYKMKDGELIDYDNHLIDATRYVNDMKFIFN
jgi:PBSX family phage terminase large subunit